MSDQPTVACPSCGTDFCVDVQAIVPDEQRTTIRITSQSPFVSAEVIGRAIVLQSKVLRDVAKSMGCTATVFVSRMLCEPGVVEIEFLITVADRIEKRQTVKR